MFFLIKAMTEACFKNVFIKYCFGTYVINYFHKKKMLVVKSCSALFKMQTMTSYYQLSVSDFFFFFYGNNTRLT